MNKIICFSEEARSFLFHHFDENKIIYSDQNLSQSDFWCAIYKTLISADIINPLTELPDISTPEPMSETNLSDTDLGLFLYQKLGKLEPAVLISDNFWSYVSHRYLFESVKSDIKRNQFFIEIAPPKGLNRHKAARHYLTTLWTAEFLEDDAAVHFFPGLSLEQAVVWTNNQTDAIMNMIDRSIFSYRPLRSAMIAFFLQSELGHNSEYARLLRTRDVQREFWKHINRIFAGAILEVLTYEKIYNLLCGIVQTADRTATAVAARGH